MSGEIENLSKSHLIKKLMTLNLPVNDYAIFGSAPLAANGLIDFSEVSDLDLVARGKAWEKAKGLSKVPPTQTDLKFGEVLSFFKNIDEFDISIYTGWPHGIWDVNELIDTADLIGGIRFVKLENVLKWKKARNRPKDAGQIAILEKHLGVTRV